VEEVREEVGEGEKTVRCEVHGIDEGRGHGGGGGGPGWGRSCSVGRYEGDEVELHGDSARDLDSCTLRRGTCAL